MNDIGGALTMALSGGYTQYFDLDGRSYKVVPQVAQRFRLNADQILDYYIKTGDGSSVPLSTVARCCGPRPNRNRSIISSRRMR